MRLEQSGRTAVSSGVEGSTSFGISEQNSAHIMTILRDTLYSDRVLAVLREYGSNAWDAHNVVGKGTVPIEVKLPTQLDPELSIRDHGPGLSCDEMFRVYTQYGESTKRDSDDFVGMLGIGSKSGFAYSDTFTVTSWKDGRKSVYVAALDESGKGRLDMLLEEACGPDESGLEVKIAVKRQDINEFHDRASRLFSFFSPRPSINITLTDPLEGGIDVDDLARIKATGYGGYRGWRAMMGCVAYPIDLAQVGCTPPITTRFEGIVRIPIGGAHVNASREALKYSDLTRKTLTELLTKVGERYVEMCLEKLTAPGVTVWDTLCIIDDLRSGGLPIPPELATKRFTTKNLDSSKEDFRFIHGAQPEAKTFFHPQRESVVLIRDDARSLKGYSIPYAATLVCPLDRKAPISRIRSGVQSFFKAEGFDGIPIKPISTLPWVDRRNHTARAKNDKHRCRMFAYNGAHESPLSKNWDPVDRNPDDEDVYVSIDRFEVEAYDFYAQYKIDRRALEVLDMKMPSVYGYKPKKPGDPSRRGLEYTEWRKKKIESLLKEPRATGLIRRYRLRNVVSYWNSNKIQLVRSLRDDLGEDHRISLLLKDIIDAMEHKSDHQNASYLSGLLGPMDGDPDREVAEIVSRYPLIGSISNLVTDTPRLKYTDYIRAMDLLRENERQKADAQVHDNE